MNDPTGDSFLLPQRTDPERLAKLVGGPQRCVVDESLSFDLTFFDSFDWRLHAAGLRLMRLVSSEGGLLRLKREDATEVVDPVESDVEPAWPAQLPGGLIREQVAALLEMRVLLPVVSVHCRVTELRVLNEDAKTVARLQFLAMQCDSAATQEPRMLWPRVRVLPVLGYESECQCLVDHFAGEMEWPYAPACVFDESVAAIGREPGDYSSKLTLKLKHQQHAVGALRKILLTLLGTIERNLAGTRANLDSEFLHDLRVATRRTRSALSQVKQVLPDSIVEDYKQRFGWLGQVTGPTRDLDVFLLELPRYRASLPAAMAHDLDALEAHLLGTHKTEQARLKRKLGSAEMRTLLDDWRAVLEADPPPGDPGLYADLPIELVAARRIWRMYRKVIKAGRAVTTDGAPEAMHELRKDCKKLRYLLEFFRSLFPDSHVKKIVRALKNLLDILGDFQDLEVQADELRGFAAAFAPDDPARLRTVMAIGALVADLLRHQQAAHERFAGAFADFDSAGNRAEFKRLFKAEESSS
ncbi:MAG: CHAD domain-containing protein [Gammaproteobacteria bacterium]|nr:CHAD domain-containing protein [Gammaproteobacteria bacterium]